MYILILFFVIYVSNHFFIKWVLRALGVIIGWLALNPSSLIKGFQVYSPAPPDHVRFFLSSAVSVVFPKCMVEMCPPLLNTYYNSKKT